MRRIFIKWAPLVRAETDTQKGLKYSFLLTKTCIKRTLVMEFLPLELKSKSLLANSTPLILAVVKRKRKKAITAAHDSNSELTSKRLMTRARFSDNGRSYIFIIMERNLYRGTQ